MDENLRALKLKGKRYSPVGTVGTSEGRSYRCASRGRGDGG